ERYLYHEYLAKPMAWATSSWCSIFRTPRGNLPVDYPVSHYRSLKPFRENIQRLCELAQRDGATVAVVTQPMLYKESMTTDEQRALLFARDFCAQRRSGVNVEPSTESLRQAHAAF